ncbi:MAG: LTA synthase family protein, partial [Flavobacteriaceae bacterium]
YNQPIRSWGRSLVSDHREEHFIINSDGIQEHFIIGDYIYLFNGKEITGIYKNTDIGLENNLLGKINSTEIKQGELLCKAWHQDYMNRVINKKLDKR